MTLFVSEDSQFEAAALQSAVDADREEEATPGAPPRLGVRVVLVTAPPLENLPAPFPNQDAANANLVTLNAALAALAEQAPACSWCGGGGRAGHEAILRGKTRTMACH